MARLQRLDAKNADNLRLSLSSPIGTRRHPYLAPEYAGEITTIGKPDFQRHFGNAFIARFQQCLGLSDPIALEVVNWRDAALLSKAPNQMLLA